MHTLTLDRTLCLKADLSSCVRRGQLASDVNEPHGYFREETRIGDFRRLKMMPELVACFFRGTNQILKTFVIEGLLVDRRFRARYLGFCDGEEFQRIFFPQNFVAALFHRIFLYFHTKIELSGFVRIR